MCSSVILHPLQAFSFATRWTCSCSVLAAVAECKSWGLVHRLLDLKANANGRTELDETRSIYMGYNTFCAKCDGQTIDDEDSECKGCGNGPVCISCTNNACQECRGGCVGCCDPEEASYCCGQTLCSICYDPNQLGDTSSLTPNFSRKLFGHILAVENHFSEKNKHKYFSLITVRSGHYASMMAMGIGRSKAKLKRASSLALACQIALTKSSWLSMPRQWEAACVLS